MKVETVHNILGWFNDALRIETRRTFKYDKGNDVTIVERQSINVQLYTKKGEILEHPNLGSSIDKKV